MYTSTFSDWFCQAVIDFMLGYRTISVFSEFLLKLQSTDPRDLIRLSRIRAEAIATSVSRVLVEGERLLSGWTVFSPVDLNTKVGDKFEEKVILLVRSVLLLSGSTAEVLHRLQRRYTSLYVLEPQIRLSVTLVVLQSYDYTLEKVKMYTRVPLGDILQITKGGHIHSA